MKKIIHLICLIGLISCSGQKSDSLQTTTFLSISPIVDKENSDNQIIISNLRKFLLSKNDSPTQNEYWLDSDFDKYIYPYADIYQIEKSKYGEDYFKPSLMELIDIQADEKLLKIGFIGFNPKNSESIIKCIYNIHVIKQDKEWKFKKALEHQTKDWKKIKRGSITYLLPTRKKPNEVEIKQQEEELKKLCQFLETAPIPITYYSCDNPKQVFEIKGFDYYPNMYFSKVGGMADHGNIIYSGNNSEEYPHEIVHIYTQNIFPGINRFLDEGLATYIGGSGGKSYAEHRVKMKEYLSSNNLNLSEHTRPYEQLYIDNDTPIPYMIGALICERINRVYGKEKLFEIFNSKEVEIWKILQSVDLNKSNLTEELKKELSLSPTMYSR